MLRHATYIVRLAHDPGILAEALQFSQDHDSELLDWRWYHGQWVVIVKLSTSAVEWLPRGRRIEAYERLTGNREEWDDAYARLAPVRPRPQTSPTLTACRDRARD